MLLKSIFILGLAATPVLAQAAAWVCPRQKAYERRNAQIAAAQARKAQVQAARQIRLNLPRTAAPVADRPSAPVVPVQAIPRTVVPAPAAGPVASSPVPVQKCQAGRRPLAAATQAQPSLGSRPEIAAGIIAVAALGTLWMANQTRAADGSHPEEASENAARWRTDSDLDSAHDRAVQAAILAAAQDRAGDRP